MREHLSQIWNNIQGKLFPYLEKVLEDPLSEKLKHLVSILELIRIEDFVRERSYRHGRFREYRKNMARGFIAQAVYDMSSRRHLIDMLRSSPGLRRICGWERVSDIPHESTFARAFAEFAEAGLTVKVHDNLVAEYMGSRISGHVSRDSTAIEAREKPVKKEKAEKPKTKRRCGRPRKGQEAVKEPTRLERQETMSLEQMLEDLPKVCDVGVKKNSKGYKESWIGYKLHIDAVDGQIPVSCILTSASVHDSQAALPLGEMTSRKITSLYDIMDSAYDSPVIRNHSISLGHKPIIDINPRRNTKLKQEIMSENKRRKIINFNTAEDIHYNERSNVERVNSRLKDDFGGRKIRVRGFPKVLTHLMFGILALTADQLLKLVT